MTVTLIKEIPLTCAVREQPGNFHFEGMCESCDAYRLSRLTLGQVEDRYYVGRISQDQFEAYCYVFDLLSPYRGTPTTPEISGVLRVARALFRFRGLDIPEFING